MKPITIEEIRKAEKILLPEGKSFGNEGSERIEIIKSNDQNLDIVACPGSGKTTVLLAKLLILAERMPFENGGNICVLTHTNVAINEIKERLGSSSSKLFSYPNFFGTIQSFVDKFLAVPAYIDKYSKQLNRIDSDVYKAYFNNSQYRYLGRKAFAYCKRMNKKNYPYSISYSDLIINTKMNKCEALNLDLNIEDEKKIYEGLKRTKKYAIESGYLNFMDAYNFADFFISKYRKQLKKSFSQRFKYVFVDEMQDTDKHQLDIIKGLFEGTETITQYFGDPNQAIFNYVKESMIWKPGENGRIWKNISDSKRFGENISEILNRIKIDNEIKISGNPDVNSLKPILIIFKTGEEEKVLKEFAKIIKNNESKWLPDLEMQNKEKIYKAVGWVGKERTEKEKKSGKLNIQSYFPKFEKKSDKQKQSFENLKYYLCRNELADKKGAKVYFNSIISALLKVLELAEKKDKIEVIKDGESQSQKRNFTKSRFLKKLKEKEAYTSFRQKSALWINAIHSHEQKFNSKIIEEIRTYLKKDFKDLFGYDLSKIEKFINPPVEPSEIDKIADEEKTNFIEFDDIENIKIEVGTVHSIKGETHTATLYFETFFDGYELERINGILQVTESIEDYNNEILSKEKQIKDLDGARGTKSRTKELSSLKSQLKEKLKTLKMLHVGFSRPTHLLCFAISEDRKKYLTNPQMFEILKI